MAQITIEIIKEKEIWENFVENYSSASILQSYNWGQFQRSLKRPVRYLGIFNDKELVGVCLAFKIKTRFRSHIYVPNGPLIEWENAPDILPPLILKLRKFAKETDCAFVRMDPLIINNTENKKLFKRFGLIKAPIDVQAPHKWVLDITPDTQELLTNMKKNTRYAIKRSSKEGVEVFSSLDFKDFENFWELFTETVKRQNFIPFSKDYYIKQIKAFAEDLQYRIYWAKYENKILSAALIPYYKDTAYYLHAASSPENRNVFAAHALIYQAILDAKENNIKYFDFCGVAPNDKPNHPWAGFSFFKKGFGGFAQEMISAYDIPINNLLYFTLIRGLESTQQVWSNAYYKLLKNKQKK